MDILSLLFGLSLGGGAYVTTGAITGRIILSKLLSEDKFHLLRRNGGFAVVSGRRQEVMKLSEVPVYEAELKRFSRAAVLRWPHLIASLYGPRRVKSEGISQKLHSRALDGQRNAVGVKLMERNLDRHPLMMTAYLAQTDEEFAMLHKAIKNFDRTGSFNLTEYQLEAAPVKPSNEVVLLSSYSHPKSTMVTAISRGIAPEHSRGLPADYRWRYSVRTSYSQEQLYVALVEISTDRTLFEDGFYTHIWRSKMDRRSQTRQIKKKLIRLLDAHLDPEGHRNRVLRDVI